MTLVVFNDVLEFTSTDAVVAVSRETVVDSVIVALAEAETVLFCSMKAVVVVLRDAEPVVELSAVSVTVTFADVDVVVFCAKDVMVAVSIESDVVDV